MDPSRLVPTLPPLKPTALMAGKGFGWGPEIMLFTNHLKVGFPPSDHFLCQYKVSIKHEDGSVVVADQSKRRAIIYEVDKLLGIVTAFDGGETLYSIDPVVDKREFAVTVEDNAEIPREKGVRLFNTYLRPSENESKRKRIQPPTSSTPYKVSITCVAKISMRKMFDAIILGAVDSKELRGCVRVLNTILRHHVAKAGCLLVPRSFIHNLPTQFVDIGSGVVGCRRFHSSFKATQGGLSLNMAVSTAWTLRPGPVMDFLILNQNVTDPDQIDWTKARKMLRNLKIRTTHVDKEYKVTGLSDHICGEQKFTLKQRKGGLSEGPDVETTVYNYFLDHHQLDLISSKNYPCINVGKPKRPTYIPIELCSLVSLQRYTKSLSNIERAKLVETSRQNAQQMMTTLVQDLIHKDYAQVPVFGAAGISVSNEFTKVRGRVLAAPKLLGFGGTELQVSNGRWNFKPQERFNDAKTVSNWACLNFQVGCDALNLARSLQTHARERGMKMPSPFKVIDEKVEFKHSPAPIRVENMVERLRSKNPPQLDFLLCILPEKKNSDIYGSLKSKGLSELGIVTQCIIAPKLSKRQYLTNVLLKINAKLGGIHSSIFKEEYFELPGIHHFPTLIVGMHVSHGCGRSDVPSIAAVVGSRQWPSITRYWAAVRAQSPDFEMIDSLFKQVSDTQDEGIFREILVEFYQNSNCRKPKQIIIFRSGVSESQFNQVLNVELQQIMKACEFLDKSWSPKFLVVVAQKNHHTRFFQENSPDNVPPGTVVDTGICLPRNRDFYMCAHAVMSGTTRPTHYHVLHDQINLGAGDLQELVHYLSYVSQRSTTATSIVAPVRYAQLAARQMSKLLKYDGATTTTTVASTSAEAPQVIEASAEPKLPKLHDNVREHMFFC